MKSSGNLLIDVLSILPEEIDCYIQAPSLENEIIKSMMIETEFDYYKLIRLDNSNKAKLINQIAEHSSNEYFQSIEIRFKNNLLFEGFDGIEFGTISKNITLPQWFIEEKILNDLCLISSKW